MLPTSQMQEALSRAYVRAVAARAGLICESISPDFGFDLFLRSVQKHGKQYWDSGPQLDIQLKSTTWFDLRETEVVSDLEVRAYNLLRQVSRERPPCVLVLFVMPRDESLWLTQSEDELILRHCAYWMSFRGAAPTENETSIRVVIPRGNAFSVEGVQQLLAQMQRGTT
jgi:hypothetical protein